LNNKSKDILKAIFEEPIRSDIKWNDIENLVQNLGGKIKKGSGSKRMIEINGKIGRLHEPHNKSEIKKYAVKYLRSFLEEVGFSP